MYLWNRTVGMKFLFAVVAGFSVLVLFASSRFNVLQSETRLRDFAENHNGLIYYWDQVSIHGFNSSAVHAESANVETTAFLFPKREIAVLDFSNAYLADRDVAALSKILDTRMPLWMVLLPKGNRYETIATQMSERHEDLIVYFGDTYVKNGELESLSNQR